MKKVRAISYPKMGIYKRVKVAAWRTEVVGGVAKSHLLALIAMFSFHSSETVTDLARFLGWSTS